MSHQPMPRLHINSPAVHDALAALTLLLASVAVSLRAILHGGLFFDDWWIRGAALYDNGPTERGGFDRLDGIWTLAGFRPGSVPLYFVQNILIDIDPRLLQVFGTLAVALLAWTVYALLVVVRLPRPAAFAAAALVVTIPVASTTRYWGAAQNITVAAACAFGALAILGAGAREGRRGLLVVATVLFAYAVSTYESVTPLLALAPAVLWRVGATRRLAVGVTTAMGILALLALVARRKNANGAAPVEGWDDHAEVIVRQAWTLLRQAVVPDGRWLPFALVGLVVVVVVAVIRARRTDVDAGATAPVAPGAPAPVEWLQSALVLVGVGVVVTLLGYVMLVPASPWYMPLQPGQGTRTNGVAMVGIATTTAGAMLLVAVALTYALRTRVPVGTGLAVAALLVLTGGIAAGFVADNRADGDRYIAQWTRAEELVEAFVQTVPRSEATPGTTMLSFGRPGYVAPLIQSLGEWSDLDGAVKVALGSGLIQAYPIFVTQPVVCAADGIELPIQYAGGPVYGDGYRRAYGQVLFVQAPARRYARIDSRAECERELARYPRGAVNF